MSVENIISKQQQKFLVVNNVVDGWYTPECLPTTNGVSSLSSYSFLNNTVKIVPDYIYPTNYKARLWIGTNSIPYSSSLDGQSVSFTVFIQLPQAARITTVLYETSSDPEHNIDENDGSWFSKWTTDFPHDGVIPPWPYDNEDKDLKTFFENSSLRGVVTQIELPKIYGVADGFGRLSENKWSVVRTSPYQLPQVTLSRNLGIFIEVEFMEADIVGSGSNNYGFFSIPSLTTTSSYLSNQIGLNTYRYLPDLYKDNDSLYENPNRKLSRLIDVFTHFADIANEYVRNWRYFDILDGFSENKPSTYSKLVSAEQAPLANLIWLSQFVGSKRDTVKPTSTPWSGMPSTWAQIEEQLDANADDEVSWRELETYSPGFTKLEEYLRFAISTGYVGFNAGTEQAVLETVKFFLENNKQAWIERYPSGAEFDKFSVKLYTYIGDTPDATGVGGTSEIVLAAIEISKPVGIYIKHEILADE
jgi:hypothetical protein